MTIELRFQAQQLLLDLLLISGFSSLTLLYSIYSWVVDDATVAMPRGRSIMRACFTLFGGFILFLGLHQLADKLTMINLFHVNVPFGLRLATELARYDCNVTLWAGLMATMLVSSVPLLVRTDPSRQRVQAAYTALDFLLGLVLLLLAIAMFGARQALLAIH